MKAVLIIDDESVRIKTFSNNFIFDIVHVHMSTKCQTKARVYDLHTLVLI